ncbi:MAG: LexA family transcriptional regulator [Acinetobacter populi]|jgi:SOS-response transcriptional repressor LexA|uniref:LexA family protein n=1 Tax=Acinetobacter populi TaxID=1582270 RepID=UPI00235292DE|nr:LexA family transcriptional regulator [Acinetobacter populi]MCH4247615.1 LexA family transcriptional regulator [Acinetobacter populi]
MSPKSLLKVDNTLPKIELVQLNFDSKLLPKVENEPIRMQQPKYQDFAKRLNELMKAQGSRITTITQIKDTIGVTYEMARRYTLGTAKPREEKMKALADAFNVSISYLDHGDKLDNNIDLKGKIKNSGKLVPVISWVAAGSWTSIESIPVGTQFDEWLPANPKCGKNGYGLIVSGESMSPKFEPDDRIYINPDFQVSDLKTGDLVIVACEGEKEATFKKLVVENDGMYLEPLNPKWQDKIMELHEGCKLVGKVVGLYREV